MSRWGLVVAGLFVSARLWAAMPAGVAGHWRMDGTLEDAAGQHPGRMRGGDAVYVDGVRGRGIQLNSRALCVDVGNDAALDFAGAFSIGGWVFVTADAAYQSIVDKSDSTGGFLLQEHAQWPGAWMFKFQYKEDARDTQPVREQLNQWAHVLAVYDGAIMRLYRNGELICSTPSAGMAPSAATLRFGKVAGVLDEMVYYPRALSSEEVADLMTATRDSTPPVISAITAELLPNFRAAIRWQTDVRARRQVEYTLDSVPIFTRRPAELGTQHEVRINGLVGTITCRYRVRAENAQGFESVSAWQTLALPAVDPRQQPMLRAWTPFTVTDRTWPADVGQAEVCLWADDKLAAVSIGVDDNSRPDHAWWLAMGKQYGFHFTWWVVTGGPDSEGLPGFDPNGMQGTWADFRTLHAEGHEIASHSLTHNRFMTNYDEELGVSKEDIEAAIPGLWVRTYASPWGNDPPAATLAKYYLANRGVTGGINPANAINYSSIKAYTPDEHGHFEPERLLTPGPAEWNRSYRGWQVMFYHYVKAPNAAIESNVLKPLYDNRDAIWVGRFCDVAMYAQSRDAHALAVDAVTPARISFTLTDTLSDLLFDYPLTVKVRVDNGWGACRAVQNGQPVEATLVTHEGNSYVLVKVVPDRGVVDVTGVTGGGVAKR
ncbi:MAG: polysaccharide deacetylase family protein [Lentisphaerae bacterium]|nr:polysaccharide deacetylase family protein [Lentisphaerota bacterium]